MQRRQWLKLGLASAAVLAVAGGAVVMVAPGLADGGKLAAPGRRVFGAAARGLLDGVLPTETAAREAAIGALLHRVDGLVGALPPHAQAELSQLLALLDQAPGRRLLADLDTEWDVASVEDLQHALQSMRSSAVSLRQQAYHALHDIANAAYFSDAAAWSFVGYPGPLKV